MSMTECSAASCKQKRKFEEVEAQECTTGNATQSSGEISDDQMSGVESKLERRELKLPPAPERPLDSDCCGGGCQPCVMDIYEQELALWQDECERLRLGEPLGSSEQDGAQTDPQDAQVCPTHYKKYTITRVEHEALDVVRIRFQLPHCCSLGLSIGQHVIIRFGDKEGKSTTRQYTPASPLSAKGYFELMIKIYPEGRASQIVKEWRVGDGIDIRGPAGHLNYKPNKYDKLLMFCAGTGVLPMFQVTHAVLSDEEEDTRLRMVYAARDYSCIIGRQEMNEWRRYWNFSCLLLLSQEPQNPRWRYRHGEEVVRGRLTEETIRQELGSTQLDRVLVLICGTRPFDNFVLACLRELGMNENNIHRF